MGKPMPIHRVKAEFFRTLGHPVGCGSSELLRDGEMTVGDLQAELGIDSSGTSQHLGGDAPAGILEARKEGTSVYYSVRDPRVFQLLESARQVIGSHLEEANALLGELGGTAPERRRAHREDPVAVGRPA